MLSGIHLYSLGMHFLSEEEKKKDKEEKKDSYNDKLLNKYNFSYEQSLNKSSKCIFIWFVFLSLFGIFLSIIICK